MTIEEKRKALGVFCEKQSCPRCPLGNWEVPSIWGCNFDPEERGGWADDLIDKAYDLVFNPPSNAVDHPGHYNREGAMECIDEMVLIFGKDAVMHFCLCNAWKYRYRAADKNGLEDLKKSDWYLTKYNELIGGDGA